MPAPWYIAADVGGTNIRLGAYHDDRLARTETHSTKAGTSIVDAIRDFSASLPETPKVIVVAAAGPVSNNAVQLTNAKQRICGDELAEATGAQTAQVINDFVGAAWSAAAPASEDLITLQGASTPPDGTRLVIGPGTGLGVGALGYHKGQYFSLPGEGGHVGIGPYGAYETEVFKAFRTLWPDVFFGDSLVLEAEGMLSGTGLPILYQAVQAVETQGNSKPDAGTLMGAARDKSDPIAVKTAQVFRRYLGQVAGDLGLAFGAEAGVFLVGGVAMKNAWLFDDAFIDAFNTGGRFTSKRQALNLYLLNSDSFGLQGAFNYARQL